MTVQVCRRAMYNRREYIVKCWETPQKDFGISPHFIIITVASLRGTFRCSMVVTGNLSVTQRATLASTCNQSAAPFSIAIYDSSSKLEKQYFQVVWSEISSNVSFFLLLFCEYTRTFVLFSEQILRFVLLFYFILFYLFIFYFSFALYFKIIIRTQKNCKKQLNY